jgi:hypothetical protein
MMSVRRSTNQENKDAIGAINRNVIGLSNSFDRTPVKLGPQKSPGETSLTDGTGSNPGHDRSGGYGGGGGSYGGETSLTDGTVHTIPTDNGHTKEERLDPLGHHAILTGHIIPNETLKMIFKATNDNYIKRKHALADTLNNHVHDVKRRLMVHDYDRMAKQLTDVNEILIFLQSKPVNATVLSDWNHLLEKIHSTKDLLHQLTNFVFEFPGESVVPTIMQDVCMQYNSIAYRIHRKNIGRDKTMERKEMVHDIRSASGKTAKKTAKKTANKNKPLNEKRAKYNKARRERRAENRKQKAQLSPDDYKEYLDKKHKAWEKKTEFKRDNGWNHEKYTDWIKIHSSDHSY